MRTTNPYVAFPEQGLITDCCKCLINRERQIIQWSRVIMFFEGFPVGLTSERGDGVGNSDSFNRWSN
jgi:hypothetical protein